ncbi:MAG: DedA family protein [Verrucomicrobia bacterium]|nr:DedA family protein [Verrucomicrobiota bacterium]
MKEFVDATIEFARANQAWAAPMVFVLAFMESLAFLSLLAPATVILVGIGGLIGASGLEFWPIWGAAVLGAGFGDWVSYAFGVAYKDHVKEWWPFRNHPEMLPRGERFMARFGVAGVFIGRFFGPLRAVVPVVAGICKVGPLRFQIANWASAIVWAAGILGPGTILGRYFS